MNGPPATLAHLVFSTRAAEPRSGTEFNREVVAESPGVPEAARRELARLGDMTGPVLRRPELPPLWAFRRLDEESWLVVRAVSLGLYRKGHHQLLVHGVVLPREVLERLDGNPFLLATEEARDAGFRFLEEHPGGRRELSPLPLDPAIAGAARRLNLDRLRRWSARFEALDPAFPALHDAARDRARPTAVAPGGPPDPRLLEWLLLHFHPADRAELSFHTWYAYEQAVPFDLLGVAPEEVPDLRGQLRELDLWTPDRRGAEGGPGALLRRVRADDPDRLPQVLERYYLTLLSGRHRLDLRREPFHPLAPGEAELCLRGELGEPLTEAEEEARLRLSLRGDTGLYRHAADLGATWRRGGPEGFEAHLGRLAAAAAELRRLESRRMPPVAKPEERLGLLALLPHLAGTGAGEGEGAGRLRDLWEEVVPPGTLDELLGLLEGGARAELGERILAPWVAAVAPGEVAAAAEPALWSAHLRWLHRTGRPVAPAAARIERLLEEAPGEAALTGLRRLQRICAEAALGSFATRLLFLREIPRLPADAARIRLGDGVRLLLREDGAADAFLGPFLAEAGSAAAVLEALAAELVTADPARDPVARWARGKTLLEAQSRPALPPGAAGAAGNFVARLALSPLAERTAEALDLLAALGPAGGPLDDAAPFRDDVLAAAAGRLAGAMLEDPTGAPDPHLPRGLAGLVAARLEPFRTGPSGEPRASVDRALLDSLGPALVLFGPEDEGGARLRGHLDRYLEHLVDDGRLPRVAGPHGPWRHLLLDELQATPPRDPEEDPRYRAYLELAWHRWAETAGTAGPTPAEMALLRAFPLPAGPRPDRSWHLDLATRTLPPGRHPAAEALVARTP